MPLGISSLPKACRSVADTSRCCAFASRPFAWFQSNTPPAEEGAARQLKTPMLFKASHLATALSAVTAGFDRPSDWWFVGARAYLRPSKSVDRVGQDSVRKPK